MDARTLEQCIAACLEDFYKRRLEGLAKLSLRKVLSRKNPYLYCALGINKPEQIVEQIMVAHVSSSDETIFGDAFFEPMAKFAAGAKVSEAEGVDFALEFPDRFLAVSVKSGPNWGNSSQHKRQGTAFDLLRGRLNKIHKQFDPLCGHCYGRQVGEASEGRRYRRLSGQAFWQEITGDPDYYLKVVRLMREIPAQCRPKFQPIWDAALKRFTEEFVRDFCGPIGTIDWEKLVAFSSAIRPQHQKRSSRS